jgi:autophagy-related protein 16
VAHSYLDFDDFDFAAIHEGGITSVQFNPTNSTQVLTNAMDSCLKIVDIRTCTAIHTLRHPEFQTSQTWSKSVFSPDGRYVAAGSSSNGTIFVWDISDGSLIKKLPGHTSGVCGIDWSRGGSSGQQVASIDRKGTLILWA